MNEKAPAPALDLPWIAVPLAMVGGFLLWEGLSKNVPYSALHGTIILAFGIALWFEQRWARVSGAAYFLILAGGKVYQQVVTDFTIPQMLAVAGCASLGWALWHWREAPSKAVKRPLVSIVLLLRQARFINAKAIARAAAAAWGCEIVAGDPADKGNIVAGETPLFLIRAGTMSYLLHNQNQGYFDHAKEPAINESRLREAIAEHRAWIAVDLLDGGRDLKTPVEAYQKIGRLVAELAGPDCAAVVCPESAFICAFDDAIEEKLRSPDPLNALGGRSQEPKKAGEQPG